MTGCLVSSGMLMSVISTSQTSDHNRVAVYRATEMDVTMIGLQNAGKTSLLRVLAVSGPHQSLLLCLFRFGIDSRCLFQGGEFTIE